MSDVKRPGEGWRTGGEGGQGSGQDGQVVERSGLWKAVKAQRAPENQVHVSHPSPLCALQELALPCRLIA